MHDSLEEAAVASVRVTARLEPNARSQEQLEAKYAHYRKVIDALGDAWEASPAPS
jgi:sugar (pentulose or hexulose) kinase